jgi:hypothetical protein
LERFPTPEEGIVNIPEKLLECLKWDGVVAIATQGPDGPHLVNTWNSYVQVVDGGRLLVPAGGLQNTEANLARDNRILVTLGSSKVPGQHGPGTGFLIEGTGAFASSGPDFEAVKARFGWARAVLAITMGSATQTL